MQVMLFDEINTETPLIAYSTDSPPRIGEKVSIFEVPGKNDSTYVVRDVRTVVKASGGGGQNELSAMQQQLQQLHQLQQQLQTPMQAPAQSAAGQPQLAVIVMLRKLDDSRSIQGEVL